MTERGLPIVDGAPACPFVAFDDDRDERATSPDHRHRCFAENPPAPRALAHQEAYCLSSAFPVCPTFQDWARREAAHARAGAAGPDGGVDDELPPLVADRPPRRSGPQTWAAPPPWLRGGGQGGPGPNQPGPNPPGPSATGQPQGRPAPPPRSDDGAPVDDGAGTAAGAAGLGAAGGLAGSFADRLISQEGPGSAPPPREQAQPSYGQQPPGPAAAWDDRDAWTDDADGPPPQPAGPGRGWAGQPPSDPAMEDLPPRRRGHERVDAGRDDPGQDAYAPAWERPRRLEAYPTLRSRRLSSAVLPTLLLGVVVVLLVAAALFFLPSLLGLGGGGTGGGASPSPSVVPSIVPESLAPTVAPEATPFTYVVKSGDLMSTIAKRFGVPLADLIAANADTVPNPDKLQIGDVLIIPTPAPSELPGASQP